MAVIDCRELPRSGRRDERQGRTYYRKWLVTMDIIDADPYEAEKATGVSIGDPWLTDRPSFDTGAQCRSIVPEQQDEDYSRWIVTAEYSSNTTDPAKQTGGGSGSSSSPYNDEPLRERPTWSTGAIHDTRVQNESLDVPAKRIQTSARQPIQPRPTVDKHRESITFVRNEGSFNRRFMRTYWDKVNEKPFLGDPPRTWKIGYIIAQQAFRNRTPYFIVTYYLENRFPDWDHHFEDVGTRVLDNNNKPTIVVNGLPNGLVRLDGRGKEFIPDLSYNVGTGELEQLNNDPPLLDFKAYTAVDFAVLDINID